MKLHASFVALLNHKLERIPKWFRSLSLHTGKISAPRLYIRFIKCICSWPYLENHSITTGHLERIQSMQKPLLYLLHIHSCYSLVANYMKPRPTKLIFWKFASLFASCTIDREYKQCENYCKQLESLHILYLNFTLPFNTHCRYYSLWNIGIVCSSGKTAAACAYRKNRNCTTCVRTCGPTDFCSL